MAGRDKGKDGPRERLPRRARVVTRQVQVIYAVPTLGTHPNLCRDLPQGHRPPLVVPDA